MSFSFCFVIIYKQNGEVSIFLNDITDGIHSYSGTDSKDIIGDSSKWIVSPKFSDRILQYKPLKNGYDTKSIIEEYALVPCEYYDFYDNTYDPFYYNISFELGKDIDETIEKFDSVMEEYLPYVPQYVKEERKILVSRLKERFGASITSAIDGDTMYAFYTEIKDEIPLIYDIIDSHIYTGNNSIKYKLELVRDTNKLFTIIPNKVNGNYIKRISKCSASSASSEDDFSELAECSPYKKSFNAYYDLIISEGIESIGRDYFADSYVLSVKLPSTLKTIESGSFKDNYIKELNLSKTIEEIGDSAFLRNQIEGKLVIPGTLKTINNSVFSQNKIDTLILEEGIIKLGNGSFSNNKLIRIIIPENVTKIGRGAFSNNPIEEVVIPASVTEIGLNAFKSTTTIKKVTIKGDKTRFNDVWTDIGFPSELMPAK